MKTHQFQVDLSSLIRLLSEHLYSSDEVFIRELIQNALDALTARKKYDPSFSQEHIELELLIPASGAPSLVFSDNGIGLTEEEVHRFLSTVASSSKREGYQSEDFIGQFGIGLLSCFLVTDEIIMITQSAKGGPAVEWRGKGDGTYSIKTLGDNLSVGTRVYLSPKAGKTRFFQPHEIRRIVKHFGDFLPIPIHLISEHGTSQLNKGKAPWDSVFFGQEAERDALLKYGHQQFGQKYLDAIPLRTTDGQSRGVAFVLPYSKVANREQHRVYLKHMLLTTKADGLVPEWASFVKVVLNSNKLRPAASREAIHPDVELDRIQKEIGEILKAYLQFLAQEKSSRFDRLMQVHFNTFIDLALEDDEFFQLIARQIPFATSAGDMKLGDFLEISGVLRFTSNDVDFQQLKNLAQSQQLPLLAATHKAGQQFVQKFIRLFPEVQVEETTLNDFLGRFEEPDEEMFAYMSQFLTVADEVLADFKCKSTLKGFVPKDVPALYSPNGALTILRNLEQNIPKAQGALRNINESFANFYSQEAEGQLCFNVKNETIRYLIQQPNPKVQAQFVRLLYLQALMAARQPLGQADLRSLDQSLLQLLRLVDVNKV